MLNHIIVAVISVALLSISSFPLTLVNLTLTLLVSYILIMFVSTVVRHHLKDSRVVLLDRPVDASSLSRVEHDKKRFATYPYNGKHANTWYHLCDSKDLENGRVLEVRAVDKVFAVWRRADGTPVVQDAFCLHLGANLAVGGKVVDDCLECPFHRWKFSSDGSIAEIPYINNPKSCPTSPKLKTYKCVDWCGLVCVYYHSNPDAEPEFDLPDWVPKQMSEENWCPHLSWDIGHVTLTPNDWVDQAGDHAHFHTLHADFLVPYTLIPLPVWLTKLVPLGICHDLCTYKGDDAAWVVKMKTLGLGLGSVNKYLIYFTDKAGLTWNKKAVESTLSETLEMYVGPAMMSFHIPFTIGAFKVFVTTTPTEGGSIMRARTWVDNRVRASYFKRGIAWLLTGISASQLASDIVILENKIRQRKPILQPFDGPYNRTSAWLKIFYSAENTASPESRGCEHGYTNDW